MFTDQCTEEKQLLLAYLKQIKQTRRSWPNKSVTNSFNTPRKILITWRFPTTKCTKIIFAPSFKRVITPLQAANYSTTVFYIKVNNIML